jgi:hypothetical protein
MWLRIANNGLKTYCCVSLHELTNLPIETREDPDVLGDIEVFLTKGIPLSQKTRDALQIISIGIVMQMDKSQKD